MVTLSVGSLYLFKWIIKKTKKSVIQWCGDGHRCWVSGFEFHGTLWLSRSRLPIRSKTEYFRLLHGFDSSRRSREIYCRRYTFTQTHVQFRLYHEAIRDCVWSGVDSHVPRQINSMQSRVNNVLEANGRAKHNRPNTNRCRYAARQMFSFLFLHFFSASNEMWSQHLWLVCNCS